MLHDRLDVRKVLASLRDPMPGARGGRGGAGVVVAAACLSALMLVGCGSRGSAPAVDPGPPTIATKEELQQRLEYIATSGMAGSGLAGIPDMIARLENKAALEADYRRLEAAGSADQIKSIAQEMLKKL